MEIKYDLTLKNYWIGFNKYASAESLARDVPLWGGWFYEISTNSTLKNTEIYTLFPIISVKRW